MNERELRAFEIFRTDLHGWYFKARDETVFWLRRKDRLIYKFLNEEKRWALFDNEPVPLLSAEEMVNV